MLVELGSVFRIMLIFFMLITQSFSYKTPVTDNPSFQKGMAFPSWVSQQYCQAYSDESLRRLSQNICAEWVQFVPTRYQKDRFANEIYPEAGGRTADDECLRHAIRAAKNLGLKIMLKPHVDSHSGDWRGTFQPTDPDLWFENYQRMITSYAGLAQEEGVEIFSIGCEFVELSTPEFTQHWSETIEAVRTFYQGLLVYSANWWQEYEQIEFWSGLDYIGIDAYVPLTSQTDPSFLDLLNGWSPVLAQLETFSMFWNRPVIFTEIGYRSMDGANMKPWDWEIQGSVDLVEQAQCYFAVIRVISQSPWLQGIYWWNWEPDPSRGGPSDSGYTPQGKPAETVLKRWYCGEQLIKKGRVRR